MTPTKPEPMIHRFSPRNVPIEREPVEAPRSRDRSEGRDNHTQPRDQRDAVTISTSSSNQTDSAKETRLAIERYADMLIVAIRKSSKIREVGMSGKGQQEVC